MPYRKKRVYRKKYSAKYPNALTRTQKSQVRYIAKSTGETKAIGVASSFTFASVSTSPIIFNCTEAVIQGDGKDQRVGDKLTWKYLTWKSIVQNGDDINALRVMVLVTEPAENLAGVNLDSDFNSVVQDADIKRVVYDKMITLVAPNADEDTHKQFNFSINLAKLGKWKLQQYNKDSAGGRYSDLKILVVSDSAGIPNPGFTHGFCRITYKDN